MSGIFRKKRKFHDEPQQPIPAPLAPPPAQVAPAPVPPAAPAPALVEPPQRAKSWPYGAYEFQPGAWYVRHGSTNAGPFARPEEYWDWVRRVEIRDRNLEEADRATANTVYAGPFSAAALIHRPTEGREAAFIYAADCIAFEQGKGTEFIYRRSGLFSGMHADISRLINYGEQEQIFEHKSYAQTMADFPDTALGRAVRDALASGNG